MFDTTFNHGLEDNEYSQCKWKCEDSSTFTLEDILGPHSCPNPEISSNIILGENNADTYKEGKWTKAESENFKVGLQMFGECWTAIKTFVPTRNGIQIRSHAQKFFRTFKNKALKEQQARSQGKRLPFVVVPGFRRKLRKSKFTPIQKVALQTLVKKKYIPESTVRPIRETTKDKTQEDFDLPPLGSIDERTRKELDETEKGANLPFQFPIMELENTQGNYLFYQNKEHLCRQDFMNTWKSSNFDTLY